MSSFSFSSKAFPIGSGSELTIGSDSCLGSVFCLLSLLVPDLKAILATSPIIANEKVAPLLVRPIFASGTNPFTVFAPPVTTSVPVFAAIEYPATAPIIAPTPIPIHVVGLDQSQSPGLKLPLACAPPRYPPTIAPKIIHSMISPLGSLYLRGLFHT